MFNQELSDAKTQLKNQFKHLFRERYAEIACGLGWLPLVRKMLEELQGIPIEIGCIKEKFGGLRVYYSEKNEFNSDLHREPYDIVHKACAEADKTCEFCGNFGVLRRDRSWIRVLCDDCHSKAN